MTGEDDASEFADDALEVSQSAEVGCILGIYTLRFLKDTLSTSPF